MTIIILAWMVFTIVYFRKEIVKVVKGKPQNVDNTRVIEDADVFGSSNRTDMAAVKSENINIVESDKNENSGNLDVLDASVDDVTSDDFDIYLPDSGDSAVVEQDDDDIVEQSAKNFEDLCSDVNVVLAAMKDGGGDGDVVRAVGDLRGTHLFGQLELAAGSDGKKWSEKMLDVLEKEVWEKDYEREKMPAVSADEMESVKNFDINSLI